MLDAPTMPVPITLSATDVQTTRRKSADDRQRAEDLRLAGIGPALPRGEALAIAARMSARGDQKTVREERALRELMRRHGLTGPAISREQQRQEGAW